MTEPTSAEEALSNVTGVVANIAKAREQLLAQRAEIDRNLVALESVILSVRRMTAPTSQVPPFPPLGSSTTAPASNLMLVDTSEPAGPPPNLSLKDRIMRWLADNPGPRRAGDIARGVTENTTLAESSARSQLAYMARQGDIYNTSRGWYSLNPLVDVETEMPGDETPLTVDEHGAGQGGEPLDPNNAEAPAETAGASESGSPDTAVSS